MYPPPYYPPQYTVDSYVPCMFCHTTIPVNAMPGHLAQCQSAQATSTTPIVTPTPFGSTQSIQYRRVVRVEKKSVNNHSIPIEQQYIPQMNSVSWNNQVNPLWTIEDISSNNPNIMQSREAYPTSSSYMARPLPPPPQVNSSTQQTFTQSYSQPKPLPQPPRPVSQSRSIQSVHQKSIQSSQPRPVQQSKPVQTIHPTQTKPVQAKPVQVKPVQATQQRSIQAKPVELTQAKPVQAKPVQAKPVQAKPVQPVQPVQPTQPTQRSSLQSAPVKPAQIPASSCYPRQISSQSNIKPPCSPVKGEVEILQPASFSERIKMFESQSSSSVKPPTVQSTTSSSLKQNNQPNRSLSKQSSQPISKPSQPVHSSQPSQPPQPPPIQRLPQPSQPLPPVQHQPPPPPPPSSSRNIAHYEKQDLHTTHPNKLTIPTFVSGQPTLDDILQRKIHQQHQQQQQQLQHMEITQQPKPLVHPQPIAGQKSLQEVLQQKLQQQHPSRIIEACSSQQHVIATDSQQVYEQQYQSSFTSSSMPINNETHINEYPISDTPIITTPSAEEEACQLVYTANDVYVLVLNKEEVKTLFLPSSTLPSKGYQNAVFCIYTDQFCFYCYDENVSEYQLLNQLQRIACVNTRLDRMSSSTNRLCYGILIMDKTKEEILSVWFTTQEERDDVFNKMIY